MAKKLSKDKPKAFVIKYLDENGAPCGGLDFVGTHSQMYDKIYQAMDMDDAIDDAVVYLAGDEIPLVTYNWNEVL